MKKIIALLLLIITITGIAVQANNAENPGHPYRPTATQKPIKTKKPEITEKPINKDLINRVLTAAYDNLKQSEAEYKALSEKFNMNKPFTKLIKRQEMYIDMLAQLYNEYGLTVPNKDWDNTVRLPNTPEEYYNNSLIKEKNLTEMYKTFLKEELPQEVRSALYKLMELSANNARLYKFILEAKAKKVKE